MQIKIIHWYKQNIVFEIHNYKNLHEIYENYKSDVTILVYPNIIHTKLNNFSSIIIDLIKWKNKRQNK